METKEMKAEISKNFSPSGVAITLGMYFFIPILLLIIGFSVGTYSTYYGSVICEWFDIELSYRDVSGSGYVEGGNIVALIAIVGLLPLALFGIHLFLANRRRKLSTLSVSNQEIIGSYTAFIPVSKITLKMPIEKIDNIGAVKSLFFLYTGKALRIASTSGVIRIPYVLNADEIVAFISEAIEKAKANVAKPALPQSGRPQQDVAEALKKFAELRDAGIITEEEFNQKKQELLKMM